MPSEDVRVESFLLADGADVVGGKLYVLGGGWNYLNLQGPRDGVGLISVVGRIPIPLRDAGRDFEFIIQLEYGDNGVRFGGPRLRAILQPSALPGSRQSVETATPVAFDLLGLTFPWPGEYAFVMSHNGKEVARTRFQVNFSEPDDGLRPAAMECSAESTEPDPDASLSSGAGFSQEMSGWLACRVDERGIALSRVMMRVRMADGSTAPKK